MGSYRGPMDRGRSSNRRWIHSTVILNEAKQSRRISRHTLTVSSRVPLLRQSHFDDACNVAWYSGFLWYSTNRKPQLISVERSFVLAFLSFRNFSILIFSSR